MQKWRAWGRGQHKEHHEVARTLAESEPGPSGITEAQGDELELSYQQKVANCTVIAKPMAEENLTNKCYELITKAMNKKKYVRHGIKDVHKKLNKGETGIVVFAGDVTPIDIIIHLPVVCENNNVPYVYVPSRKDLGASIGSANRNCPVVLIRESSEYKEAFDELKREIEDLPMGP